MKKKFGALIIIMSLLTSSLLTGCQAEMQNELETINTVLRPTFQLAVRDDIIRKNPVDGAYCEVKKRNGGARKTRRALTVDQQRKFMEYVAKNPAIELFED